MIDLLLIFNAYFMHLERKFAERKQSQSDISAGQLMSKDTVKRMISDDLIFSLFKNRRTPLYFHNMLLDVLAKIRQFGYTLSF